jgi:acyl-lipid omega-6 desaturase (Delta-12 desaturase)
MMMNKSQSAILIPATPDTRGWPQMLARYRVPSPVRSVIELAITGGPFVLLWFLDVGNP